MSHLRSRFGWLATVASVLVLGALWWSRESAIAVAAPDDASAQLEQAVAGALVPAEARSREAATYTKSADDVTASAHRPLPPPDASLEAVIAELLPRAEAGDARAACRLGFELLRCESLQRYGRQIPRSLARLEANMAQAGHLADANRVAEDQLGAVTARAACESVDGKLLARGSEFLYLAARSGQREAMLRFIAGDQFGYIAGLNGADAAEVLAHPQFDQWRREAPIMASALLARGDTVALWYLHLAYAQSSFDLFSAIVPDDPVQAAALRAVQFRTMGRLPPAEAKLTARQREAAERAAATLLSGPFADAQFERELVNRLQPPAMSLRPDQVARCD